VVVDLVAMPMPLGDRRRAIDPVRERAGNHVAGLRAKPHRTAQVRARIALFDRPVAVLPLGDQCHHRMGCRGLELGAVGVREPRQMSRALDHCELHAKADAQVGHLVLARIANRRDLSLDPALAEAPGTSTASMHRALGALALDGLRVDVVDVHVASRMDASVDQRLGQRLVDSVRSTYLPTIAMCTECSGCCKASTSRFHVVRSAGGGCICSFLHTMASSPSACSAPGIL